MTIDLSCCLEKKSVILGHSFWTEKSEGGPQVSITRRIFCILSFAMMVFDVSSISANSQVANAGRETPGAPDELIGVYGNSPKQCRSFHRKTDNLSSIGKEFYTFCGGTGCEARIVSNQKTKDGFILKLVSRGNPEGWIERIRIIDPDAIEVTGPRYSETLVRCSEKDAIAGIGIDGNGLVGLTRSLDVAFAAYYALTVPSVCPDLHADVDKVQATLEAGRLGWTRFVLDRKLGTAGVPIERDVARTMATTKAGAEHAVDRDSTAIKEFCKEVLDAFGRGGRVMPDLLKDPRKQA